MESRNPRKIGMGVPHILGLLGRGCQNLGVPIFLTPEVNDADKVYMKFRWKNFCVENFS